MTEPRHSHSTGPAAPGTGGPDADGGVSAPAFPRSVGRSSDLEDAHSPASPYTVTTEPLPAPAAPPPAPVVAPVEPQLLPTPEPQDPTPPQGPESDPDPDPDPVPRPYAVLSRPYAADPRPHVSPVSPSAAPIQADVSPESPPAAPIEAYVSPVPPPSRPASRTSNPLPDLSLEDVLPLVTERPYTPQGPVAFTPPASPTPGAPPAYGSAESYVSFAGHPIPPTFPRGFGTARPRTENVGRGLLLALVAVVGGCVLSAVVYHLGYVASIVALAMGAAGIFLYAKGAGAPPRNGAVALVALMMAGILLAWVSSVGTGLYFYYVDQTGGSSGALVFAVTGAFSLDLFKATLKDFLIFVGFGALGIFGVARQLLFRSRRK